MIVDFTPNARDNLTAIGEWISRDNPARAQTFVDVLIDRAESLAHWPARFSEVDRIRHPGVRMLTHRGYRIYYRVRHETVEILHVHHGARNQPEVF